MSVPLLEIEDLTIQYETENGLLTAVSDASMTLEAGEYYGLVGESGCGKTTIAKAIMGGLADNGRISSGTISFQGEKIQDFSEKEYNEQVRWKDISWIPQSSMNSLDPLKRINEQALDLAKVHTDLSKEEALDSFREMLNVVGLQESRLSDYPHQFSGGMQQRVMIAFALFLEPKLVIADEPTTALDVIMQDQIFKYLDEIRGETDISMLLITHDISLVFESCDEIAIMHSGQVAEEGSVSDVYKSPHHPYSILLQNAFPDIRYPDRELSVIEGIPPKTMGSVERCTFADRCPWSTDKCREAVPELEEVTGSDGAVHRVSCFHNETVYQDYLEQSIPTLENQTK